MAPPGYLLPHRLHRADLPQWGPQADSPVTSRHGESEAAATGDVVEVRYVAPTSSGFRSVPPLPDLSQRDDNVGGVKPFSATLLRALEQERHFALAEEVLRQPWLAS